MTTDHIMAMDGALVIRTIGGGILVGTTGVLGFGNQTIIIHGTVHGTTHGTILTVSTAVIIIMAILIMDTMVTEDVLTPTLTAEDRGLDMEIQEV